VVLLTQQEFQNLQQKIATLNQAIQYANYMEEAEYIYLKLMELDWDDDDDVYDFFVCQKTVYMMLKNLKNSCGQNWMSRIILFVSLLPQNTRKYKKKIILYIHESSST